MAVCPIYSFATENSKLFAEELIEYVLKDFGHIWTAARTVQQTRLRANSMFAFTPEIGKVVVHLSRKHGGFIIWASYDDWKYIKKHRDSVQGMLLNNTILSLCRKCKLEDDDLGLFIFMAIAAEYARCAMVDNRKSLVKDVVKIITYCMTYIIPGGFVETLDRMQFRASTFEMSETLTNTYDSELSFTSPFSMHSTTPTEFESSLKIDFDFRLGIHYNTTKEELEEQLRNRELHREFFRREMQVHSYFQSDTDDNSPLVSDLDSIAVKYQELKIDANAEGIEHESSRDHFVEMQVRDELHDASIQAEKRESESSSSVQEDELEVVKCGNTEDSQKKALVDSPAGDSGAPSEVSDEASATASVACEEEGVETKTVQVTD